MDGKLTGSKSRFLPQTQGNKLDFQLEAFRFQQVTSNLVSTDGLGGAVLVQLVLHLDSSLLQIYIACSLGATAASFSPDPEHKACSFYSNRYVTVF